MPNTLAGFPFWTLQFDKEGVLAGDPAGFINGVAAAKLTDLFVFSHGWNNDATTAMTLYTGFFGEMRKIVDNTAIPAQRPAVIGVAGVIWPSILFPGDTQPSTSAPGGAADFTGTDTAPTLDTELPKVFTDAEHQPLLQDLLALLNNQPSDNASLLRVRDILAKLVSSPASDAAQENVEVDALRVDDNQWIQVLTALNSANGQSDGLADGGAASLGSFFDGLWNGAKNAVRVSTYWEMKNRAGVVGRQGLGPLTGQLHAAVPALRVHLLGHSFGARLVSYTLAGLPALPSGAASPVKMLYLLQGAFSHFAFASALPFDSSRKGDLSGMAARVDGPLLATHSLKDLAVGAAYPAASVLAAQDASDASDILYRWEGMGHDGAQAVGAFSASLGPVQTRYPFARGQWVNLDGNQVIVHGGLPSGAHSDIIHPETAWAALTAAGLV